MNTVETNGKRDRVELNNLNASPQSGQGGGRVSSTDASCRNHGGGGGAGFRDKMAAVDGSSSKIHAAHRDKSYPMNAGLIPGIMGYSTRKQ